MCLYASRHISQHAASVGGTPSFIRRTTHSSAHFACTYDIVPRHEHGLISAGGSCEWQIRHNGSIFACVLLCCNRSVGKNKVRTCNLLKFLIFSNSLIGPSRTSILTVRLASSAVSVRVCVCVCPEWTNRQRRELRPTWTTITTKHCAIMCDITETTTIATLAMRKWLV